MPYEQPPVYLWELRINEPITTLTDLLVSFLCFYAFYQLRKEKSQSKTYYFLLYYFLTMGIATLIGGLIGHAFFYAFSKPWKLPGWFISMASIALLERAAIEYARPLIRPRVGKFFSWLNIVEISIFVIITAITLDFFFVEAHSAYGLLVVVFGFNAYVYYYRKARASKFFLIAVMISSLAALFYRNKWGVSPWFNHTDISHCFMAGSIFCMYIGSKYILSEPVLKR